MTSSSEKATLRQTLQIHARAFKDMQRYCPDAFCAAGLHAAAKALGPYATVYLSALLIDELAGPRRPAVLWRLALAALAAGALFTLLTGALQHWQTAAEARYNIHKDHIFAHKLLAMDFADVDNAATHALLAQIRQNENWASWGLRWLLYGFANLTEAAAGILGAAVLTVSLFTRPVPQTAGALAALNSPWAALLLAAALALAAMLPPLCQNKATGHWARFARESTFGNRIFAAFGRAAQDKARAMDIRMYNQQALLRHYMEQATPFDTRSPIARCARGPMGLWAALGSGCSALLTGCIYLFVCLKAWAGAFGVGAVTQYVGAVSALAQNISLLMQTVGSLRSNAAFLRPVYEFLDIPNQMYKGSLTTEKRADRQYQVEFRDVSFKYPGSDSWALRHVNFRFKIGERMAVVGENGSGKTTFIKLLCRLYDPQEGQILLNGIDIRKYDYRDYMALFAVVFQDFQLLAQPLGANVAGAADYDRQRAARALEDAGFGQRLAALPNGLDTVLFKEFAEDGQELSGGEAQKVAIARALYRNAPFIILDEPTAALDPVAEAEIYARFNDIAGDKTTVYISHRLSSCKFCDEITVFDHGTVVQQGAHEQLLADTNGKYYALWQAQAQYYN